MYFLEHYTLFVMKNRLFFVEINKKRHLMKKILQDCDYTKVCLRENVCLNSIIVPLFSLLVAKYGT